MSISRQSSDFAQSTSKVILSRMACRTVSIEWFGFSSTLQKLVLMNIGLFSLRSVLIRFADCAVTSNNPAVSISLPLFSNRFWSALKVLASVCRQKYFKKAKELLVAWKATWRNPFVEAPFAPGKRASMSAFFNGWVQNGGFWESPLSCYSSSFLTPLTCAL